MTKAASDRDQTAASTFASASVYTGSGYSTIAVAPTTTYTAVSMPFAVVHQPNPPARPPPPAYAGKTVVTPNSLHGMESTDIFK
jgi:hypothetical protein